MFWEWPGLLHLTLLRTCSQIVEYAMCSLGAASLPCNICREQFPVAEIHNNVEHPTVQLKGSLEDVDWGEASIAGLNI